MNEQIPVNLLKEGKINDWNEWRSQHSEQHLDLTNTDLSGLDLTSANLSNSNLSGVDLTGTNLQDTDFTEASNIKDIIIRNEKEDDFRNACHLLLKTGQKFFSINFDDQSRCYESQAGLEAILYEYFNNYYQSIDYSKYDEFLGVYMVDLETASYFAVINWGEAHEDEGGGWSFKYTHTTAKYNCESIDNLCSGYEYGGEHPPDTDKMEQFLIQNRKSTTLISQKGSPNNLRDLRGQSFVGRDLRGEDFSYADLTDADFELADCTGANFEGANLEGAYLEVCNGGNLKGANFKNTYIGCAKGADFTDADLSQCRGGTFENAIFTNAKIGGNLDNNGLYFKNIDFTNADFCDIEANWKESEVIFENCIFNNNYVCISDCFCSDFSDCKFTNSTKLIIQGEEYDAQLRFINCDLAGVKLELNKNVQLEFINCDLTGIKFESDHSVDYNFNGYNLRGAVFAGVFIEYASFSGSDLTGADFTEATTESEEVDFSNANLTNANFSNANLTNANFSNANLTNANFSNANLTNANLSGADLTDADLTNANLEGIITDENTRIEIPEE